MYPSQMPIKLALMPQLTEAKTLDDDWTGMADPASRRRRQIRLGTRAYRRRKAVQAAFKPSTSDDTVPCWDEEQQAVIHLPASLFRRPSCGRRPILKLSSLPTRVRFPLSSDHLIILIQLNVLRAYLTNGQLLEGLVPGAPHDCSNGSVHTVPLSANTIVPPTLAPTMMQSKVMHERWVDSLPHPVWRDNFLRALGTFDEEELGRDLLGDLVDNSTRMMNDERCGIVVWSPPWHYEGWELTEGFVRKWGWTIKGCPELLEATNKWRSSRGEERLTLLEEN